MYITFKDKKIQQICEDESTARRKIGSQQAKILAKRLSQIEAAENLSILRNTPGKCHPLNGSRDGQYALHLAEPYRLVLGIIKDLKTFDEELVTEVEILEITDYH